MISDIYEKFGKQINYILILTELEGICVLHLLWYVCMVLLTLCDALNTIHAWRI